MSSLCRSIRATGSFRCPQCFRPRQAHVRLFASSAPRSQKTDHKPSLRQSLLRNREARSDGESRQPASGASTVTEPPEKVGFAALRRPRQKGQPGDNAGTSPGKKPRIVLGQSAELPIRTRFAPSPTGFLHLGSLRTALFNNLASAVTTGGSFILRLEDTDQGRLVEGAEQRIYSDLKWFGLSWSEGPDCGGPYAPYKQSERLDIYRDHVQQLVDSGHAYRCFCKPEDLENQKRQLHESGQPTAYPGTCRSVREDESSSRAAAGEAHAVRFKGDSFGLLKFRDAIYGPFQKQELEEDFIIMKTDGYPTYHLANVVDDHLMQITHVIRGEEWLISTPKHLALYKAFGWKPPTFAHLGLLTNDDGSKLSKRNDSANVSKYRQQRYSPMALQPWLANLGSSFSANNTTPRTLQDVAELLTFKFTRGGIKLNLEKLDDYEGKYRKAIIHQPVDSLADKEEPIILENIIDVMDQELQRLTETTAEVSWPNKHWSVVPKEPVPALGAGDEDTAESYLRRIFSVCSEANHRQCVDPAALVVQHPHYFWSVPLPLYQRGVAQREYDQRVVDAIERVCGMPDVWTTGRRGDVMDAVWESLGRDTLESNQILYKTQRFIATGNANQSSQDASIMFVVMGRKEWADRVAIVKSLIQELAAGGEKLKQQWLHESESTSY